MKVLTTLFATLLIVCGKVNFTNLSRYSHLNEKTYRRCFTQRFDFAAFNAALIQAAIPADHPMIAVLDASFIAKSGRKTFGLDRFYNGCHSRVEKGLELSLVAVIDAKTETGYALRAEQSLPKWMCPDLTRIDLALLQLEEVRSQFPASVRYLAVDGYYANAPFVLGVLSLMLHVVSKLRSDANLRYEFTGAQKARGAKRKYDGKVDLANPDLTRWDWVKTVEPGVDLYTQVVWHFTFKRRIRIAYLRDTHPAHKPRYVVLFSTDLEQPALEIYQTYKLRFQIEFLFRDAKQFLGLAHCQARDDKKLDFHFNASFTALNLAKLDAQSQQPETEPWVCSITSLKRRAFNEYLLDRFIAKLDLDPTLIKSHPNYQSLCNYGMIAA